MKTIKIGKDWIRYIKNRLVLEKIVLLLLLAIILALDMKKQMVIHIASDEFGYWTAAANIMGWNWSNSASVNSYYSFGYGWILALLMLLIKNPIMLYKAALLVNIIFIQASFLVLFDVFKKIFNAVGNRKILIICFGVSCYCSNIFNVKLTLTECVLWFLYSALLWLLLQFLLTKKPIFFIATLLVSGFMFMVHMRSIAVVAALFLALIVWSGFELDKRKSIKICCGLIISLFLIVVVEEILKGNLIQMQYGNSDMLDVNNIGGQTSKVKMLFSMQGISFFISGILGRLFYLGYATMLVFFFGCFGCLQKIRNMWLKQDRTRFTLYIFIFLSLFFALSVSTIFSLNLYEARTDFLFYGRYSEYVIAPVIIIGLIELLTNKKRNRLLCYFGGGQLLLSVMVSRLIIKYKMSGMLDVSIPAFFHWVKKNGFLESNTYLSAGLIAIILAVFLCILCTKWNSKKNQVTEIIIFVMCLWWVYLGHSSYTISDTHKHDEDYVVVYQTIEKNIQDGENVYYCFNEQDKQDIYFFMGIDRIQFCIRNRSIRFLNIENYETVPENSIIITRAKSECLEEIAEQPEELLKNIEFNVYRK